MSEAAKARAAFEAVERVRSGMILGLASSGGRALLRDKIVALASRRCLIARVTHRAGRKREQKRERGQRGGR
jgi:ribose 5-phosphate isomerase